jgi:hypothetical protein
VRAEPPMHGFVCLNRAGRPIREEPRQVRFEAGHANGRVYTWSVVEPNAPVTPFVVEQSGDAANDWVQLLWSERVTSRLESFHI